MRGTKTQKKNNNYYYKPKHTNNGLGKLEKP